MAWEAIDSAGWLQLVGVNLGKVCCPTVPPEDSLFSMQVFHEASPETVLHVKPVEWPDGVIHLRTEAVMLSESLTDLVNDANRNLMFGRAFWVSDPNVPDTLRYVVAESFISVQNLDASGAACGAVYKAIMEHEEAMGGLAAHGSVLAESIPDAQWLHDPTKYGAYRWWDGRALTDMVSDGSQARSAPMPSIG
jgi:hypothetical protein